MFFYTVVRGLMNNAEQQNKQGAFVSLIRGGTRLTEHRKPPFRQCLNVSGNYIKLITFMQFILNLHLFQNN